MKAEHANRQRTTRVLIAVLAQSAAMPLPLFLTGATATLIREDFHVGYATFGAGLSAFFVAAALTAMWGGRFTDRQGWHRALRIASIGNIITLFGIAGMAQSFGTLVAWLAVGGVSLSIGVPVTSVALISEMPVGRRGLLFGIGQSAAPVATLIAGLSLPLVAIQFGWRWTFVLAALLPLTALLLTSHIGQESEKVDITRSQSRRSAEQPGLFLLSAACACAASAIGALGSFFVLSAVDAGLGTGRAGLLLAVASIGGMATRIVGGWVVDRTGMRGFMPVSVLLTMGAVGLLLLGPRTPIAILPGALLAYAAGWGWPALLYYGVARLGGTATGKATGIVQVGMSVGMIVGPLAFGLLVTYGGFPLAWGVVAALMVLASFMVTLANRLLRAPRTEG